jgi:adenylate cyclase
MALRNEGIPKQRRIEFRIGINLGDIIVEEHDIYGDGVNVAARLEALAEPGGICVSRVVRDQVRDKGDFGFEDLGEQQVKNIVRPIRVYRIKVAETTAVKPPLPLPDKPSLAVLPFQNMTGDPEQEYFVDGIVEEITTAISRLPWLFIIARNSSFTYRGRAVDVKQVARELGVRYVLEGSVRKAGNRVRITGQLIDTATGAHIWADRFDGSLDNIFELQDQVASSVVGAIEPKLRQSEIERAIRKPTENLDAYDLYLRGLAQFNNYTERGMRDAIKLLGEALAIDSSYAPAAALKSWCRAFESAQGWGPLSETEITEAVQLAWNSIEAGKDDPDVLWKAGWTIAFLAGDRRTAVNAVDRALSLNPNSAHAWYSNGWVQFYLDHPDKAVVSFEKGLRLSPRDPLTYLSKSGLALAHLIAGRYQDALRWADEALAEQPRVHFAMRAKAVACAYLDQVEEGRQLLERLLELQPDLTIARFNAYGRRFLSPRVIETYLNGLRKLGLPEE